MNNQTRGPLVPHPCPHSSHLAGKGGFTVAATYDLRHDKDGSEEEANRNLLAAAYSAFDKAGRELGVDATVLAQTIDLVRLVRVSRNALTLILDEFPISDERHKVGTALLESLTQAPGLMSTARHE